MHPLFIPAIRTRHDSTDSRASLHARAAAVGLRCSAVLFAARLAQAAAVDRQVRLWPTLPQTFLDLHHFVVFGLVVKGFFSAIMVMGTSEGQHLSPMFFRIPIMKPGGKKKRFVAWHLPGQRNVIAP